jgi:hypothetical protein
MNYGRDNKIGVESVISVALYFQTYLEPNRTKQGGEGGG